MLTEKPHFSIFSSSQLSENGNVFGFDLFQKPPPALSQYFEIFTIMVIILTISSLSYEEYLSIYREWCLKLWRGN